jgi:peptide/nickel transport system ATP-binding protein
MGDVIPPWGMFIMAETIMVMYAGEIVETGKTEEVFTEPLHPYTKALLSAVPIPDPKTKRERINLEGEVPNLIIPPRGCRFHPDVPQHSKRADGHPAKSENH